MPVGEVIPDGEPYVFEDPDNPGKYRVYVYGSHDIIVTDYCGKDQVVWSAPVEDLSKWRYDGVIFESKKDRDGNLLHEDGSGDVLFAPDVTMKKDANGRKVYYLYPNNQAGGRNSMIAKSYRPNGPFEVCNWSPENPKTTVGPMAFDPAAFVDDDGLVYGYWGFNNSFGAELDPETMCTVKPGTEIVSDMIAGNKQDKTYRFFEASSIRKIKDKYVFIYSRVTNDGEAGLSSTNYTLAYCYSNHPLGPWTYGGTIIDGRGKEKRPDGTVTETATPKGNTHGSICEINNKWYVFYHRQADTTEYSRQAMVAPIDVEVVEGETGYVKISEAEFNSEGFATEGLDPTKRTIAGIACYLMGPTPAVQQYPVIHYSGSHSKVYRAKYEGVKDPYDPTINKCPMVNNTNGSVIGYKYFNFSKTYGQKGLKLELSYIPEGVEGTIDIYLDRPSEKEGGVKIGSLTIPAKASKDQIKSTVNVENLKNYNGKHALFMTFSSKTPGKSICELYDFIFKL